MLVTLITLVSSGGAFADSVDDDVQTRNVYATAPFLLSLLLSHGAGLYKIDQSQKAKPYLIAHIACVDIPVLALGCAIAINHLNPEFFEGDTLEVTEYIVNTLVISIPVSALVIRLLECRDVRRLLEKQR